MVSRDLHFILADICGNRFLEAIVNSVIKLNATILEEMQPNPPHSIHPPGLHQTIIDAFLAGDPEAAAEAMRNHAVIFYDMGDVLHIYTFTGNDIDFPLQAARPATPTGSLLQAIS